MNIAALVIYVMARWFAPTPADSREYMIAMSDYYATQDTRAEADMDFDGEEENYVRN